MKTPRRKPRKWPQGTNSRHVPWQHHDPATVAGLANNHPAVVEARTLFPYSVVNPADRDRVLISGINSVKIGEAVTKGRWKGMPIFTLTLEERATCPSTCAVWNTCYGNGMPWSKRLRPGTELETAIVTDIRKLAKKFPKGFVVRLHVLGDFYSVDYVYFWAGLLDLFPMLHVFGFTAHPSNGIVGRAIAHMNLSFWPQCVIRFSRGLLPDPAAHPIAETIAFNPKANTYDGGIICPAQTGKTAACATCGLCWTTEKAIVFLLHGRAKKSSNGTPTSRPASPRKSVAGAAPT